MTSLSSNITMPPVLEHGPACTCGRTASVTGYGNINADVMFIGISPAREEMKHGRPLVGPSGQLLDAVLEAVHVNRDDVYCTNLCCYWNNEPTTDDIAACSSRLINEIRLVKPKLIIGLGTIVSQTLIQRKIKSSRGYVLHYSQDQDRYSPHEHLRMCTYHPSAFLQGEYNVIYDLVRDLGNINNVLGWPTDGSRGVVNWQLIDSTAAAQAMMDNFDTGDLVTIDIETTSTDGEAKDIYTDTILCIALSDSHSTYAIPYRYTKGLQFRQDLHYGFHGGIFDIVGIRREFGQTLTISEDGLLSDYACDERAGKEYQTRIHGLGPQAGEQCGAEFYKEKLDRKRLAQYPLVDVLDYCAHDTDYTRQIILNNHARLCAEQTDSLYYDLLLPAANTFADISYTGCRVDIDLMHELQKQWYPTFLKQELRLQRMAHEAGWPTSDDINVSSPKQLSKLLYDMLGMPQRGIMDRSTDRDHLLDMDHPFVDLLLEHRTLERMINNYMIGFEDDIKVDDCVHPIPILHGTSTGRLSYQDPPIQTIPKPHRVGKDLGSFRRMFVPHNSKTHCLVDADYSQLEIWVAYALSGDQQIYDDLMSGDYHGRVTTAVYGLTPKTKNDPESEYLEWNERRTQAKRITFQRFYQGGAATLANRHTGIGCTIQEAQFYIETFNDRYHGYNQWCHDMIELVKEIGYLITCFGRKRRFPVIRDHGQIRQALNFPIQSTASDVCLTSLIELHWRLKEWDSRVVWTVHDSILFEVSRKYYHEVIALIREVMTKPRHPSLPALQVEITAGDNYYDQIPCEEYAA